MEFTISTHVPTARKTDTEASSDSSLREASRELEATFLYEMLKSSGLGKGRGEFGGGEGEDHFASFLLQQQAQMMSEQGGLGLAEKIFAALVAQRQEPDT